MKIIKSCARILARAPERVSFRADFHLGVIGIFPPCCPPDLTYLEHAPLLLHLHPARPRNIIAQIFARDARPRPNDRCHGRYFGLFPIHIGAPPSSYLPYQHPVAPCRIGIQRINLWLPAECLPSRRASWIIITRRAEAVEDSWNRVSCGSLRNPVNLYRLWKLLP